MACQNWICLTLFVIGCLADSLQTNTLIVTFILTKIITILILIGCKVFGWCYKESKLPLGEGCECLKIICYSDFGKQILEIENLV